MIVKNVSKRSVSLPGLPDETKEQDKNQYFVFHPGDNEISKENFYSVIQQNKDGWDAHYCKVLIPVQSFSGATEEPPETDNIPQELVVILSGNVSDIGDFVDSCEDTKLLIRLADAEDSKEKSRKTVIGCIAERVAELKDEPNPVGTDDVSGGVEGDEE